MKTGFKHNLLVEERIFSLDITALDVDPYGQRCADVIIIDGVQVEDVVAQRRVGTDDDLDVDLLVDAEHTLGVGHGHPRGHAGDCVVLSLAAKGNSAIRNDSNSRSVLL